MGSSAFLGVNRCTNEWPNNSQIHMATLMGSTIIGQSPEG